MFLSCLAQESPYCFIGCKDSDTKSDNESKATFILIMGDNVSEESIKLGENGEIYLKADKIITVDKNELAEIISKLNQNLNVFSYKQLNTNAFIQMANFSFLNSSSVLGPLADNLISYYCSNCKLTFYRKWGDNRCPRCGKICRQLTLNP